MGRDSPITTGVQGNRHFSVLPGLVRPNRVLDDIPCRGGLFELFLEILVEPLQRWSSAPRSFLVNGASCPCFAAQSSKVLLILPGATTPTTKPVEVPGPTIWFERSDCRCKK
jgi:hypothetical protein